VRVVTLPGVFRPISDTWLLAAAISRQPLPPDAAAVDLCTGSGALAVCAALAGARDVTAVDVSRRALLTARLNARLNGVAVRARRGRLFEPVSAERFDLVVANPPYVPAATDALPRAGRRRAWDAGRDGRALLDPLLEGAPAHLRPGGAVLVTHSSIIGEAATLERLHAGGLRAEVVIRRPGPLGPLMRERAALLEARGLLERGRREEDVLVLRGTAPA
jgi:release factor glutamine methyltransferase